MKVVTIRKQGRLAIMTIPPDILKSLDVGVGDQLTLNVQGGVITAKPVMVASRKHYKLADLLSQCDKNASFNAEVAAWNNISPVGSELM